MKNRKLRKFNRVAWLLLASLAVCAGWLSRLQTTVTAQTKPPFVVRNYGGKCMEFGAPSGPDDTLGTSLPVFVADCDSRKVQQQIYIEELPGLPGHLVILRAGRRVLGKKMDSGPAPDDASKETNDARPPGPTADETAFFKGTPEHRLFEAQPYINNKPSPGQIFAIDGDSIILADNRDLVIEVQNGRGANNTPVVLGRRDLDDSEFWTFTPADGSGWRPHTGFVSVNDDDPNNPAAAQLAKLLPHPAQPVSGEAQPGTVIEVDPWAVVNLTGTVLRIPPGVTLRGSRHGLRRRAELWTDQPAEWTLLTIDGDDARVTGLLLTGTSGSNVGDAPSSRGIIAQSDLHKRVIIDHNELWKWTEQAVDVWGDRELPEVCSDLQNPKDAGLSTVRVARNFIHHNRRQEGGYGVEAHYGGFPLIEGNTFLENRHAIMSDGKACTKYLASHNLVLSSAPCQEKLGICFWHTQDFDVHGTGDNGFGGQGGQYFEIAANTFLGDNRQNFDLRGEPALMVEYHHNISLRDRDDAVGCSDCGGGKDKLLISDDNQFDVSNPTNRLGVGDFDGDGLDDLFLATGAAWYYAPEGKAQWQFLNAQTDKIGDLLFGDFDADGRTDVFTQHGDKWDVSWGGQSKWETINQSAAPMSDYHVADFIGDGRPDVFYADGSEWYFSDGGVGPLTPLNTSGFRIPHLRFGDFNADGKTDVFCVVTGKWQVSYSGTSAWTPLGPTDSGTTADLVVADFDGNGRADVASSRWKTTCDITSHCETTCDWEVSYNGTDSWTLLRSKAYQAVTAAVGVGRFDNSPGSDLLLWHSETYLGISSGGKGTPVLHSEHEMR